MERDWTARHKKLFEEHPPKWCMYSVSIYSAVSIASLKNIRTLVVQ